MSYRLFIQPLEHMSVIYQRAADEYNRTPLTERNSGFDLYMNANDITVLNQRTVLVGQGCRAVAVDTNGQPCAFWLAPRSSISKTPWRLANSLGLIDATYRGTIKAALDRPSELVDPKEWDMQRLTQLTSATLVPWADVIVVDELPVGGTLRGEGGFGSTGAA